MRRAPRWFRRILGTAGGLKTARNRNQVHGTEDLAMMIAGYTAPGTPRHDQQEHLLVLGECLIANKIDVVLWPLRLEQRRYGRELCKEQ